MDFRELWKPKPSKPLSKKQDIIVELKQFRDAWEKLIKLNIKLDDDYLEKETLPNLKKKLNIFYSNEMRYVALRWLKFKYPHIYNNRNTQFTDMLLLYNINDMNRHILRPRNHHKHGDNSEGMVIIGYLLFILLFIIIYVPIKKIKDNKKKKQLIKSFKKIKSVKSVNKKSKKKLKKDKKSKKKSN